MPWRSSLCFILLFICGQPLLAAGQTDEFHPFKHKMPEGMVADVESDKSLRLIVLYDDPSMQADIDKFEAGLEKNKENKAKIVAYKSQRFQDLKTSAMAGMDRAGVTLKHDYGHLPMNVVTVKGRAGLFRLVSDKRVKEVYRDTELHHFLTQSAALVRSTITANQTGYDGANTTVVVLDTGVDYTLSDFGNCTAPGQPASCRVVVAQDFAAQDNSLDDSSDHHGTNVSGVVAGIARGTRLAVFDVFNGLSAFSSDVITGINWAISNQVTYNISSINMSLGDTSQNATQCSTGNPFRTPISNAYNAGILTVIASGNSAYLNGLANPACTPLAVSVGAVYDANVGGLSFPQIVQGSTVTSCSDGTTRADLVACFSNSAPYLNLLAPGAIITAGGVSLTGTSQASPHVAAAVAILRGARPTETLSATLSRLTANGVSVTDPRNGLVMPRLDVFPALGSVNDDFSNNQIVANGTTNQTITTFNAITSNQFSTKQSGEPNHAGNAGGKSVWFQWTAPGAGLVTVDTHGSSFNTLLAVYTGSDVSALTAIAGNDDDGSANGASGLTFTASAGTVYRIAVDGFNGASGQIALNIQFNTDLSSGSTPATVALLPQWGYCILALLLLSLSYSALQKQRPAN